MACTSLSKLAETPPVASGDSFTARRCQDNRDALAHDIDVGHDGAGRPLVRRRRSKPCHIDTRRSDAVAVSCCDAARMHITERRHGGWFVHRDDDSIVGNIKAEGDRFRAISVLSEKKRIDLGLFPSKEDAADAVAEAD